MRLLLSSYSSNRWITRPSVLTSTGFMYLTCFTHSVAHSPEPGIATFSTLSSFTSPTASLIFLATVSSFDPSTASVTAYFVVCFCFALAITCLPWRTSPPLRLRCSLSPKPASRRRPRQPPLLPPLPVHGH